MHVISTAAPGRPGRPVNRPIALAEFDFIPATLRSQCSSLIQTFHAMHGYSCLPDMLWKAGLGGFIEKHPNLNEALRRASTTRSARTANSLYVMIATEILSMEVLAREYASWSAVLPAAKVIAAALLDQSTPSSRIWLMEHYLYPPRYNSPATTIALPPASVPLAASGALDVSSETRSFRDIVLACRTEGRVQRSRVGPVLTSQGSSGD